MQYVFAIVPESNREITTLKATKKDRKIVFQTTWGGGMKKKDKQA